MAGKHPGRAVALETERLELAAGWRCCADQTSQARLPGGHPSFLLLQLHQPPHAHHLCQNSKNLTS
eukprot:2753406-Pleurochrysis_carterae.AAC.2